MPPRRRNRMNNEANPAFTAAVAHAVVDLLPNLTARITDEIRQNENNGNNGNRRNARRVNTECSGNDGNAQPTDIHVWLESHEFRNCPLRVGDDIRFANLLPLEISDFYIILGMDWLTEHRATIDCHLKRVNFGDLNNLEFIYHGSRPGKTIKIISALKARTLISYGCEGFLASIKDTLLDGPRLESHPVVQNFPDVFPDELPGLPPERKVEFTIELIHMATVADMATETGMEIIEGVVIDREVTNMVMAVANGVLVLRGCGVTMISRFGANSMVILMGHRARGDTQIMPHLP
nr:putative reverse transcriptase domain, aspartic peptidase domain protein [Tanacetum cinerariifolium]